MQERLPLSTIPRKGSFRKLPRSFYLQPTLTVARELLGKYLVRILHGQKIVGKIVETEAYLGANDAASHAFRGKTRRNDVMFRKGGHLYVYFTYGMHFCCNVVTEAEGIGHAVLLRAVEPVTGITIMMDYRGFAPESSDERMLTNGPAKLCEAFNISRQENGTDLLGDTIWIAHGEIIPKNHIAATPRIGITSARENKWRFIIHKNSYLSRKT